MGSDGDAKTGALDAEAECQDSECQDSECQDSECQDSECQDSEWKELVVAYAKQLPERVDVLAESLATARSDGTTGALTEPRRLAHRLYGTAGSYGLEAFSAAAGRIEDVLVAAVAEGPLDDEGWRRVERELRSLREHAESAGRGTKHRFQGTNHAG